MDRSSDRSIKTSLCHVLHGTLDGGDGGTDPCISVYLCQNQGLPPDSPIPNQLHVSLPAGGLISGQHQVLQVLVKGQDLGAQTTQFAAFVWVNIGVVHGEATYSPTPYLVGVLQSGLQVGLDLHRGGIHLPKSDLSMKTSLRDISDQMLCISWEAKKRVRWDISRRTERNNNFII